VLDQITPVLLTYNEEENIARSLSRLAWAKDIVVVDSGSTDATLAVLAKYPRVRVFNRPFDTHANQWRFAIERTQITTNWILRLDADYQLTAALRSELARLDPNAAVSAYRIAFDYAIFSHRLLSSLYPPNTILLRKDRVSIWDKGHTEVWSVDGPVATLRGRIIHDDWKPTGHWLISQVRYTQREADPPRPAHTGLAAWLRFRPPLMPIAVFLYLLFGKGLILNGRAGLFYALQRVVAEAMFSLRVLEEDLRKSASQSDQNQSQER
jgi:glycosyltransferase involved in cell wall biosynthesis